MDKETIRREQICIEWQALEHDDTPKHSNWYWAVAIIALSIITIAIVTNNILLALLMVVGIALLIIYAQRGPQLLTINLTSRGVKINNQLHPFENIKSFCVKEYVGCNRLIVNTERLLLPALVLDIDTEIDPDNIRDYLGSFLPEIEQDEPVANIVAEYLGF